jgi:hypothetical protein
VVNSAKFEAFVAKGFGTAGCEDRKPTTKHNGVTEDLSGR